MRRSCLCRGLARRPQSRRGMVSLCRKDGVRGKGPLSGFLLHPGAGHADRLFGVRFRLGRVRNPRRAHPDAGDRTPRHRLFHGARPSACAGGQGQPGGADRLSPARFQPLPSLLHCDSQDLCPGLALRGDRSTDVPRVGRRRRTPRPVRRRAALASPRHRSVSARSWRLSAWVAVPLPPRIAGFPVVRPRRVPGVLAA